MDDEYDEYPYEQDCCDQCECTTNTYDEYEYYYEILISLFVCLGVGITAYIPEVTGV